MNELQCPECNHKFEVDDYQSGECPNCQNQYYYWDDDWDYVAEQSYFPGFYWTTNQK